MTIFLNQLRRFSQAAAALALVNVGFWILGTWFMMARPVFNLDMVIGLVLMALFPRIGLMLIVVAGVLDAVTSQSLTFHFTNTLEFLRASRFLTEVQIESYLSWQMGLVTLLFAVCLVLLWVTREQRRRDWFHVAALGLLLFTADVLNGSSIVSEHGVRGVAANIAGSPAAMAALRMLGAGDADPLSPLPPGNSVASVAQVEDWALNNPDRSIVFVLVESMGVPEGAGIAQWLASQIYPAALASRYKMSQYTIPFHGATTSGELRALCDLKGTYRRMDNNAGQHCLPARLASHGWTTTGLHGFSQRMFNRQDWWGAIGLSHLHFAESFQGEHLPHCGGAFRGLCDEDLIHRSFQIASASRQFVYLLTLNTHLPLEPKPITAEIRLLCESASLGDEVCQWVSQTGKVLSSIAAEAAASANPPLIVIVGDHSPPFVRASSRGQFSPNRVPAFILRPSDDGHSMVQ